MSGFGKLLKGKRSAEFVAENLGDAEALKAKEEWQDKPDAACGMIEIPTARHLLKDTDDNPIEEKAKRPTTKSPPVIIKPPHNNLCRTPTTEQ
ncbi:hypothetical protein E4U17_006556 [Claviceps sp. LM77 group G4]|nr:hypothetical protein E4U17_006556 [Claviceps sp. LM77 group G4]KAG6068156.1 hypothetical protein E4U33_005119 [Claviceps sp. LM78 group G4]